MKAAILLTAAFTFGCSVDRGACLKSHETIVLIPQYMTTCNNGVCTMRLTYFLPITQSICDQWEFPEGKQS